MKLIINGNDYHYEIEQLLRVFMPDIKLEKLYDSPFIKEGEFVLCESEESEKQVALKITVCIESTEYTRKGTFSGENVYKAGELGACKLLYAILTEHFGYTPQWGIQTGVRPTKIFFNLLRNNTQEQAVKYLQEELFISPQKAELVKEVCSHEKAVMLSSDSTQFSLYISIPFCPTRCSYCSFISHAYESIKKLIPEYVRLLCREIEEIAAIAGRCGKRLRSVYIGGGTPTVLSTEELKSILTVIEQSFDLSILSEWTVEAGRPDTLTREKLSVLKNAPVTRITINAQSFNDEILRRIGRSHTAADMHSAYCLARELGFDNINTDLIAGLEGESVDSFLHSVKCAIALGAENITVHTLALKRSSFLITRDAAKGKIVAQTSEMIQKANEMLRAAGYIPYYMYRQSKSVGNLENTGWALPGKICEYNIFMMEEVQDVFGAGAGAVTRLARAHDIQRVYNYKYPYEYIRDFEQILKRKLQAEKLMKNR